MTEQIDKFWVLRQQEKGGRKLRVATTSILDPLKDPYAKHLVDEALKTALHNVLYRNDIRFPEPVRTSNKPRKKPS